MAAEKKKITFEIPEGTQTGSCRSCGTAIAWIVTGSGKKMPVEVETKESHFARCPQAGKWRRG